MVFDHIREGRCGDCGCACPPNLDRCAMCGAVFIPESWPLKEAEGLMLQGMMVEAEGLRSKDILSSEGSRALQRHLRGRYLALQADQVVLVAPEAAPLSKDRAVTEAKEQADDGASPQRVDGPSADLLAADPSKDEAEGVTKGEGVSPEPAPSPSTPPRFTLPSLRKAEEGAPEAKPRLSGEEVGYLVGALLTLVGSFYVAGTHWGAMGSLLQNLLALGFVLGYSSLFLYLGQRTDKIRGMALGSRVLGGLSLALWPVSALALDGVWPISPLAWLGGWLSVWGLGAWGMPRAFQLLGARGAHRSALGVALIAGLSGPLGALGLESALPWLGLMPLAWGLRSYLIQKGFERRGFTLGLGVQIYGFLFLLTLTLLGGASSALWPLIPALGLLALYWDVALGRWYGVNRHYINRLPGAVALSLGGVSTLVFGVAGVVDAGGWWILSGTLGWMLTLGAGVLYGRRPIGRLGLLGLGLTALGLVFWGGDALLGGLNQVAEFLGGDGGNGWLALPGLMLPLGAMGLAMGLDTLKAPKLRADAHRLMGASLGALTVIGALSADWDLILAAMALPSLALSWAVYREERRAWMVWPLVGFGATGSIGLLSALGASPLALGVALGGYGAASAAFGRALWPAKPWPTLGKQSQWAGASLWGVGFLSLWGVFALDGPEPFTLTALFAAAVAVISLRGGVIPGRWICGATGVSLIGTLALAQGLLMTQAVGVEGALVLTAGCLTLFATGYRYRWRWIFNLGHLALIPASLGWPLLFRYALKPFMAQATEMLGYGDSRLPLAFYGLTMIPLVLIALAMARGLRARGRERLSEDALIWGAVLAGALALISLTKPGEYRPPSVSLLLSGGLYGALALKGRGRAYGPLGALALLGWCFELPGLMGISILWRGVVLAWASVGMVTVLCPKLALSREVRLIGEGGLVVAGAIALYGAFVPGAFSIWVAIPLALMALAFGVMAQGRAQLGPIAYGFGLLGALVFWHESGLLSGPGTLGALAVVSMLASKWRLPRLDALRPSFEVGGLGLTIGAILWQNGLRGDRELLGVIDAFPDGVLVLGSVFLARWIVRNRPLRWALGFALAGESFIAVGRLNDALGLDITLLPQLMALGAAMALWRLPSLPAYWRSTGRWLLALSPVVAIGALISTSPHRGPVTALAMLLLVLGTGALAGVVTQRRRHLLVALSGLFMVVELPIPGVLEPLTVGAIALGLGALSLRIGMAQGWPLLTRDAWSRPSVGAPSHLIHSLPLWVWGMLWTSVSLAISVVGDSGGTPALGALLGGLGLVALMPPRLSPALLGMVPALFAYTALDGGPWPILALSAGGLALKAMHHRRSALLLTGLALMCLVPWAGPLGAHGALATPLIPLVIAAFALSLWGMGKDEGAGEYLIPSLLLGDMALMTAIAWVGVLLDTGRPEAALLPAFALAMGAVSLLFSRERLGAFTPWGRWISPLHALAGGVFIFGSMAFLRDGTLLDHGMVLTALALMAMGGIGRARRLGSPGEVMGVEALVLVAYLYIRVATPMGDTLLGWDAPLAVVLAFALFVLGSFAKARKIAYAEGPLLWTSLALPILAFSLSFGEGHTGGALWGALGTVYLAHYILEPRREVLLTALGLYNLCVFAVWVNLGVSNLQLFALPLGLSLAVVAHVYRQTFSLTTLNILRYSGALIIFGASVFESLMSPWNSLALICLGLLSLMAGGVLKVRSYLNMGALGVCLALVLNLARFGLAYREFWALSLTILGIGLLVGLSVYSWRRDRIEVRLNRFRRWVGALE